MKIALLASTFLPRIGGAEIVVHNLARQFRAQGHDARVITWWGQWKGIRGKVDYPVLPLLPRSYSDRARRRWQAGRGSTAFVGAQVAAMQRFLRFDVWNFHMAHPAGMLAAPTLHRAGVPFVTTCHGDDIFLVPECDYRILENEAIRNAVVRSLRLSHKVTAISGSVEDRYLELGVPQDCIANIPNGVDVQRISSLQVDQSKVRMKYGWPLHKPLILTVGRFHKQKGYTTIPSTAKQLLAHGMDFFWVIVGAGSEAFVASLGENAIAGHLGSLDRVGASGHYDDMPPNALVEVMKSADVLVIPSKFETFGLVLVEAMACGLPVCTTDAPGCRDVVTSGVNGLRAPVGDALTMAAHVQSILWEPDLRNRLVACGKEYAASLTWHRVADLYLAVYEEVVASARVSGAIRSI